MAERTAPSASDVSFPRLAARTMNFRLGVPRMFRVSPDGARVAYLRAPDGVSRPHGLWVLDLDGGGTERLVVDPAVLLAGGGDEQLTEAEKARRERGRVTTSGVVGYTTDRAVTTAAFALDSRLFVADLTGAAAPRQLPTAGAVIDPRIDPTGRFVAYSDGRALRRVEVSTGTDEVVVGPGPDEPDEVVWGLAEFIAGEELDRLAGFWWAPDGESLIVERYDETPVQIWYIGDPAHPERPPRAVRYPQAGTANAIVGLAVVTPGGAPVEVDWRSDRLLADAVDERPLEYLVDVEWGAAGRPVLVLLTRDQRRMEYRELDVATGATTLLRAVTDDAWVELLPGTPARLPDGRVLYSVDVTSGGEDSRRLWIDGQPVTPPEVLVRSVVSADEHAAIAEIVPQTASVALARLGYDGSVELLSDPAGVASGAVGGETLVVAQQWAHTLDVVVGVARAGSDVATVPVVAETSPLVPAPRLLEIGEREMQTAVLFPSWHQHGSRRLPLLMDPYGGPHGQRVLNSGRAYLTSQWFAEQGFVVVVTDGRGTPGRGAAWDRLAHLDRAGTVQDQADSAIAVAELFPDDVDAAKVAIRGWSFGGYLAALGVLARPDVFAAAVAGAPTTDERLYDTCYSERYLGDPREHDDVYEANSLMRLAPGLSRPLMIIHGLADDNVYPAHALRLSSALLAAGKPHEFLPLTGMTHMANDEVVAENLLLLQLDFLRRALSL